MPDEVFRCRPMLIGDVARVAGDPRETIRTRLKQGIFAFDRPKGWKRYTDFETLCIGIHARLKRGTQDDELAQLGTLLAGKVLTDEWREDEKGNPYFDRSTFTKDRMLVFWRLLDGAWTGDLFDTPETITAALNERLEASMSEAPVFTAVNLRTIMFATLNAMIEVQTESDANQ